MNKLIAQKIDQLNDAIGKAVAWLMLATVFLTFLIVLLRYGFDWGSIAMQESVIYFHALVFMAGIAYTLRHEEHVRVDIFYSKLSKKGQDWVNLVGTLIFLLPFCIFTFWVSFSYVANSWLLLEGSREAGGLPLVFILKSFIPLMAVLLFLQGISVLARSWGALR